MSISEQVDKLLSLLSAEELQPALWQSFNEFTDEAKNELVARIVRTPELAPPGRLLSRLLSIVTEENKSSVMAVFIANLGSADPEARAASFLGLEKLGHPNITDLAIACLRDTDDRVVAAAVTALVPKAKQDPHLWKIMQELYTTHKGKPEFHMSMSLLEAHSLNK